MHLLYFLKGFTLIISTSGKVKDGHGFWRCYFKSLCGSSCLNGLSVYDLIGWSFIGWKPQFSTFLIEISNCTTVRLGTYIGLFGTSFITRQKSLIIPFTFSNTLRGCNLGREEYTVGYRFVSTHVYRMYRVLNVRSITRA